MGKIIVYTDGASKGNPGIGGAASIIIYPNGTIKTISFYEPNTTNNRMEILGVLNALETIGNTKEEIQVYTDSKYFVDSVTDWIYGWITKSWIGTSGPVKNVDLWKRWLTLIEDKKITVSWVKGHDTNRLNNEADALANYAIMLADKVRQEVKGFKG